MKLAMLHMSRERQTSKMDTHCLTFRIYLRVAMMYVSHFVMTAQIMNKPLKSA